MTNHAKQVFETILVAYHAYRAQLQRTNEQSGENVDVEQLGGDLKLLLNWSADEVAGTTQQAWSEGA